LLGACLALAACGRSDDGGGGNAGGVTTPPVIVPPPSNPPAPTYSTAFDFSQDQDLRGRAAEVHTVTDVNGVAGKASQTITLQDDRTLSELVYTASTGVISTHFDVSDSRAGGSQVGPDDLTYRSNKEITWDRSLSSKYNAELLDIKRPADTYLYVNVTKEIDQGTPAADGSGRISNNRYYVFGSRTVDSDVPRAGSSTYLALALTTAAAIDGGTELSGNTGSLQVDYAAGKVSATISLAQTNTPSGGAPEAVTLVFSGDSNSDGLKGSVTSTDGRYTGSFAGDLFGPSGIELGLAFVLTRTDGVHVVGTLLARRI
jgi:hypothetical protein